MLALAHTDISVGQRQYSYKTACGVHPHISVFSQTIIFRYCVFSGFSLSLHSKRKWGLLGKEMPYIIKITRN